MNVWVLAICRVDPPDVKISTSVHFTEDDAWREAGEYAVNNWPEVEAEAGNYIVGGGVEADRVNATAYFDYCWEEGAGMAAMEITETRILGMPVDGVDIGWMVGR